MKTATHPAASELPESEAIRLAQQGDPSAFEMLYRSHSRRVFGVCLRMAGERSAAEDLTQETFLTIFRKIHSFRGESAFSTWLHRVTVNTVLMRFRKNPPAADSLDEPNDPEEDDCRTVQMGEEDLGLRGALDRVVLDRALGRLAPGCRQMFVLHDVEGYRHDEIAEIVGCSVGNSKSQLHKARMRLREILRRGSRDRRRGRARTLAVRSWRCERPKQLDSRMATPPV